MIYPQNYEQKIAFDNIRQLLAARCLSPLGTEKVEEMAFSAEPKAIRTLLHQTSEMTQVLRDADAFPSDNFFDVREALKKIRVDGTYLLENELFDIKRSLDTINAIVKFFTTPLPPEGGKGGYFPHLQALAADVPVFPDLCRQIERILDAFGHVKDSASPELGEIRRQLAQTANSISKTLNSILRSAQAEGLVEKDVAPTMRDGRLVIPISPAFKRKLRGIVHDESATGKTVFIEPAEVVEANNKIRELESEERREIIRLLTQFTDKIRPLTPEIRESYQFLAQIDFIRAKALFALSIDATLPTVENQPLIDWIHAIHPLLLLSHRKQGKPVVPLDLELGKGYKVEGERYGVEGERLLIISGPNAGGKSVLLKTVGLLQYMLQSGLLIPVDERSKVGIFKDIFLDIGDEQSIENDLSTYSSHLTNMKVMVKNVSAHSLLLIDEFGGGTEPQIGGAIAEALLHRFNDKGSFGIITTHYQNLKSFAENHAGVVNGAMLYDRHEMQPLFRLSIGNPGSSFAIEIARKIGLPEDVIAEASDIVGQDYVAMDKYLQDIVRDKRYWENKRQKIHQQEKHLEELTERYTAKFDKVETQRKEIIAQAQAEAEKLLAEANATIEKTIREIKEAQAEKERTKAARQELTKFKQSLPQPVIAGLTRNPLPIKHLSQGIAGQARNDNADSVVRNAPIAIGDTVRIRGQQTAGEVLEIQGKNAVVAFGALKTTSKISQLEKTSRNRLKKEASRPQIILANSADTLSAKKQNFSMELDLRGMRADEALQALMYYLDDAIQCNVGRVRILHGTGTGALRQITRDYLHTASGIANYQDEHVEFGGAGVTVVELA
ncbi:endonuclease MutS2 [Candidatus Symbiothrix dinenymphae]|uniref:endonuclease MutS2 n=1 Tax=Candidatus Symbiothrix dinenymphae TaxID=467085 RepID=UPI0007039E2F|nr:Smr/MutS family protein [Candidatus Symbiothrix dinenymphae]